MIDLEQKGHKIVGFFIGTSKIPKDKFKNLLDKVTFYGIRFDERKFKVSRSI